MSKETSNFNGIRYILRLLPLLVGGIVVYELAVIISLLSFNLVQGSENRVLQPIIIMRESSDEPNEQPDTETQ